MITIRRGSERGHFNHGWLDTYHTFAFGDYFDPQHVQFGPLRVMNEDRVAPGQGFGMHGHRDMEIVTYVLSGALAHRDSLGNGETLRPGELQRMTAGTGIRHSEYNPSDDQPVHLYQIWLLPERPGLEPSYEQKAFAAEGRQGAWQLVASPDAAEGSLKIHQDARLYLAELAAGQQLDKAIDKSRQVWLQVLRGEVEVGGQRLSAGDAAAVTGESNIAITASTGAETLLFDLVA
jgi:redox-sensitive bicupin YhaK (pirin superfamily)